MPEKFRLNFRFIIWSVSAVLFSILPTSGEEEDPWEQARVWTSAQGSETTALIESVNKSGVSLKMRDGNIVNLKSTSLSEADQEFLQKWREAFPSMVKEDPPPFGQKSEREPRTVMDTPDLRLAKIAIDISSNCYESTFKGSMSEVNAAVDRMLTELNRVWIPEVGIQFEVGNLEVRTNKEDDPYQATREPGALFGIGRAVNEKHKCDVFFTLSANAAHGGGLGGGRGVWVAWGGDAWDLMHHEFSHAFGTSHGDGWPFEKGTMAQALQNSRFPRERRHMLNYREVEIIRDNTKNLKSLSDLTTDVPPYAMMDFLDFKAQKQHSKLSQNSKIELILDPLANDYDMNGTAPDLKKVDKKSLQGATLTHLSDGRVKYELDGKFANYTQFDFFHYTIEDEDGLESRGGVVMNFEEAEVLLVNGHFEKGKRGWETYEADAVSNGEAVTSVQVDFRALIQPGGELKQAVKLDRNISKKWVLEAMVYCGTEKNAAGEQVNPESGPNLKMGIFSGGKKTERTVTEKDIYMKMPITLGATLGDWEVRFLNNGDVPVRVGHVVLKPVE